MRCSVRALSNLESARRKKMSFRGLLADAFPEPCKRPDELEVQSPQTWVPCSVGIGCPAEVTRPLGGGPEYVLLLNLSRPEPDSYQESLRSPLHSGSTRQRATRAPFEAQTSPSFLMDKRQKRRRAGGSPFQPSLPFGGFRTTSGLPISLEVFLPSL